MIEEQTEMYMEKKNAAVEAVRLHEQNDESTIAKSVDIHTEKDEQAFITGVDE